MPRFSKPIPITTRQRERAEGLLRDGVHILIVRNETDLPLDILEVIEDHVVAEQQREVAQQQQCEEDDDAAEEAERLQRYGLSGGVP